MMIHRLIIIGLLLIAGVALAQDTVEPSARGIIPIPTSDIGSEPILLNPIYCRTAFCNFVAPLMFPSLVNIDPNDRSLQLANEDNFALVADIEQGADGDSFIYTLRDDAMWSDGTPITAYDVFFSYLAATSRRTASDFRGQLDRQLEALIPLDDMRLLVIPDDLDCDTPTRANFPVIPAYIFDDEFSTRADDFFDEGNATIDGFDEWLEADDFLYQTILNHDFSYTPTVNYGNYQFTAQSAQDYVRLTHVNHQQVLETAPYNRGQSGIDDVIAGEIAFYENPPANQWDDLRNNPEITTVTLPTDTWYYIAFNFADPSEPDSYRDDEGEIQEQEPHRILVSHDVREAIQLGVDVQALVDVALWGDGEVMAGYSLPTSWTHNPDLEPVGYDPDKASEILEAAGWRRINPNSPRTCIGCGTTDDENRLILSLLYDSGSPIERTVASHIAQQLNHIGISLEVNASGNIDADIRSQRFDLYLGRSQLSFPLPSNNTLFISPEDDVVGSGDNFGSYNNPEITALYDEARKLDGCDLNERRDLYHELERLAVEDLVYMPLFTTYRMTVFHNSIQNVEAFPIRTFENIDEWSVWKMP